MRNDIRRLRELALAGDEGALRRWVRVSMRSGEIVRCEEALELLLTRWRAQPNRELATFISTLSAALESDAARALRDANAISFAQWHAVDSAGRLADRGALLATLHRGDPEAFSAWVHRVQLTWERDPRITDALCRWLLEMPYHLKGVKTAWRALIDTLAAQRDPRVASLLEPLRDPERAWPS